MRYAPLIAAALCLIVLLAGLDRVGFLDYREARDAAVAHQLIAHSEVLTPLLGGDPLYEKPILAYAPEVIAELLSPRSPGASRRLRALLAVAVLLLTASAGARHFGARAAWLSTGVLVTALGMPLAARTDGTQLLGTLLGWAGCAGLADAIFGRRAGRDSRLVAAYAALGAALVCAGPLAALWPLGGLALYLALARPTEGWRSVRPLAGLAIMFGIALPWYGAMFERHGVEFVRHAVMFPYGAQPAAPWCAGAALALPFLVMAFFPWSALLPGAMVHAAIWWRFARRRAQRSGGNPDQALAAADPAARERREESAAHFFIACLFVALATVALYPNPPLSAALPALPAAALLCGRFLDHLLEDPDRVAKPLTHAVRMLALVGSAGAILLAMAAPRIHEATPELRLLGSVMLLASWAPFLANFMGRRRAAALMIGLPVALGAPLVSLRLLPAMEGYLNTRSVAEAMVLEAPRRAPLALLEEAPPSLRIYLRRNLVIARADSAALAPLVNGDGTVLVAFRPGREHELARATRTPLEIVVRSPSLVLARVRPG